MPAPEIIHQLVAKFEENREAYRSGKYNEARLRQDFLDKFFIALGWDVGNEKGFAPEYAEVEIEASLDIEGTSKSPDYAFKIGRERKFYVEAKKPAVNIQYDIHPAFQLRRYAWNAKLPLSILTDFEELAVYNCKTRPNPTDSAATGRDLFFKYSEYVERWDEIAAIFSRDAVWKGALDRYADASKGKKGTTAVDDEFLKDMNEWRINLARNIALRNPHIADEHQLNYAVQMTIDRVIFLRICEDRGIEPEEQLKNLAAAPGIYPRLVELFRRADVRYNSGLFHFNHEKSVSTAPDTFTPTLTIDDKVLKEFIKDIYYPCPYIFKEIPVEILGQVYEQFLGQVIRLTAGHQAKVEEKPEVRKAGGVYYTPKYIVDYIVANTVGKLLEGKTPVEAAALKIVDPACGSGSFLLGAFQYLIDWHEKWYLDDDPAKWTKGKAPALNEVTTLPGGSAHGYRLTTLKKKEILLNNIHGVDIDAQAVEVTKLSLLLKVLEEETGQLSLGLERALPDLGRNIQCGNSLIGEDYFAGQLAVDPAERRRVNPFEWERAFPEVFGQGGFDAVIGNPPYVRPHNIPASVKELLWRYFTTFVAKSDLYSCFMERGLLITKEMGLFSFIVPKTWTSLESFTKIREYIIRNSRVRKLVQLPKRVFSRATVETCIFVFQKSNKDNSVNIVEIERIDESRNQDSISKFTQHEIGETHLFNFQLFNLEKDTDLLNKLKEKTIPLENITNFVYGFKTADDKKFIKQNLENSQCIPFIRSANVHRYFVDKPTEYVWYVPELMIKNKPTARPADKERFLKSKIIIARMGKNLVATLDENGLFVKDAMLLLARDNNVSLKFILGLINSKVLTYYYKKYFVTIDVLKNALLSLPIKMPSDIESKKVYAQLINQVDLILDLHKRTAATPQEHEQLRREVESTDRQIDQLVYQLYGLTDEEIRIVEGAA